MATAKLTIENGKIKNHNGVYLDIIKPYYCSINGWEVYINSKKNIIYVECKRLYKGDEEPTVKRKVFPLQDGTIGLAGGHVSQRYCYFRPKKFQDILDKYKISAVYKMNRIPDKTFTVRNANYGGGSCIGLYYSDKPVEQLYTDRGRTEEWREEYPGTHAYEQEIEYKLPDDAKFLILEQHQSEGDSHNNFKILYTDEDIYELDKELEKLFQ